MLLEIMPPMSRICYASETKGLYDLTPLTYNISSREQIKIRIFLLTYHPLLFILEARGHQVECLGVRPAGGHWPRLYPEDEGQVAGRRVGKLGWRDPSVDGHQGILRAKVILQEGGPRTCQGQKY